MNPIRRLARWLAGSLTCDEELVITLDRNDGGRPGTLRVPCKKLRGHEPAESHSNGDWTWLNPVWAKPGWRSVISVDSERVFAFRRLGFRESPNDQIAWPLQALKTDHLPPPSLSPTGLMSPTKKQKKQVNKSLDQILRETT